MTDHLCKCSNPLCERLIKRGVRYCCGPCSQAHEGKYEIHEQGPLGHTETCDERHHERSGR